MRLTRREWQKCGAAAGIIGLSWYLRRFEAGAKESALEPNEDTWLILKSEIFGDRELSDGTNLLSLETPMRAEDAAIVPVTIRTMLAADDRRVLQTLTLVVDENPAPLVARFDMGTASGVSKIAMRVRVDTYSYIHAVAQLSDGKLYVVKSFVKATGGCSAPAVKNADADQDALGQLKLRQFGHPSADVTGHTAEAQVQIRHPNYSGMQMDQITRLYIPADFVSELKVFRDEETLLSMDGGISISENPTIRFNYLVQGAKELRVEVRDSAAHTYARSWPIETTPM